MDQDISDEMMMAYADGEASADAARLIEAAIAEDGRIADRIEAFRTTRQLAKLAMSGPERQPVPDALRQSIERELRATKASVVALRQRAVVPQRPYLLPMAAAIAAVVAGIGGYVLGLEGGLPPGGTSTIAVNGGSWRTVVSNLNTAASGDSVTISGGRIDMIASFKDADGRFCREFELDQAMRSSVVSVACLSSQGWEVVFAVTAAPSGEGYAPASSRDALNGYLSAVSAGEPMGREDEQEALNSLLR